MNDVNFLKLSNATKNSDSLWKYKVIVLSIILAVLNCPSYLLIYAPTIDGSLFWVFNYFADGHYQLGRHTLFPHGPLAFLLYPTAIGNNLFVASFIHVLSAFILALCWFKIRSFTTASRLIATAFLIFTFLAFADIQLLLIALCGSLLYLHTKTKRKLYFILAIAFCVFNLYIKSYGGAIGLLLLAGFVVQQFISTKHFVLVMQLAVWYSIFFFLAWWLIYNDFKGCFTFLYGQLQLTLDNSEAVQYNTPHNWWLLSGYLLSVVIFFLLLYKKERKHFLFAFLLPLFAAWKHAMARSEETHLTGLLSFLAMLFIFTWIISETNYWPKLICLGTAFFFFLFNIPFNDDRTMAYRLSSFVRINNYYNYTCGYDSLSKLTKSYCDYYCRNHHLSDSILKVIGKNTVDIYPWNYAIIASNHLNWQPRPVINSYAAYTSWLDEKNAAHWDSNIAPTFVIWESADFDGRGAELESIDERYLLNDEPKALLRFFVNYTLKIKSGNYLIYQKREQLLKVTAKPELQKVVELNEWVDVPTYDSVEVLRAKVFINKTAIGQLKSFLYKGEIFYLHYLFEDNTTFYHRIVPKNAEDGLWIHPMVLHPEKRGLDKKIKKIKLACLHPNMIKSSYKIEFEKIEFEGLNNTQLINKVMP